MVSESRDSKVVQKEEVAACAHLHVSYRTETIKSVTCGWWECDSNCGTRFFPLKRRDDYPPK